MRDGDWEERAVPSDFVCPITLSLMSHPTAGSVGARRVTFERRAIERWRDACLATGRPFCDPTTNMPMSSRLEPDALRASLIRAYFACASCEAEAGQLARCYASRAPARVVYDSRAEALAAELLGLGCCDLVARLDACRGHRAALSSLAKERGLCKKGPQGGATRVEVHYTSLRGRRFKARALSPHEPLGEVRVSFIRGVLTVQHFSGPAGAALLAYLVDRFELAPSAVRVGGVSAAAVHELRGLGAESAAPCLQRMRRALRILNVSHLGVVATRVAWRASPLWSSPPKKKAT
jgi:hypothetical protein